MRLQLSALLLVFTCGAVIARGDTLFYMSQSLPTLSSIKNLTASYTYTGTTGPNSSGTGIFSMHDVANNTYGVISDANSPYANGTYYLDFNLTAKFSVTTIAGVTTLAPMSGSSLTINGDMDNNGSYETPLYSSTTLMQFGSGDAADNSAGRYEFKFQSAGTPFFPSTIKPIGVQLYTLEPTNNSAYDPNFTTSFNVAMTSSAKTDVFWAAPLPNTVWGGGLLLSMIGFTRSRRFSLQRAMAKLA